MDFSKISKVSNGEDVVSSHNSDSKGFNLATLYGISITSRPTCSTGYYNWNHNIAPVFKQRQHSNTNIHKTYHTMIE